MNKFTAHRHKSVFSCTNNQNKQMEWGKLKDFHATHTIEPWNMWNLTTFFESNPILLQSTKQTIKWSEHKRFETMWKWTHHHKITYPTHKLCWIDHFGANQHTNSSIDHFYTEQTNHNIAFTSYGFGSFPINRQLTNDFHIKKKNDDNGRMKKTLKFAQQFPLIIWCAILSYYCVKKGLTELLLELI